MRCCIISRNVKAGDDMDIVINNLKKKYGGRTVLDIDCGHIKHGSRTAVIGPNGAGKSTLLNIIAGLLSPDEGTVCYDGSLTMPQRDVTMVFQSPYLISTTVAGNIGYPLKLRGEDREHAEQRVYELMEELNLTGLEKQKAWKLSGGEKQKVALARALSFRPGLLLLDEPTANIDPHTTAEIERLLLSIGEKQDITIVTVTHNLAQAKRMCDEVIMMHKGMIIESGSCAKILRDPENENTRRFIEGELLI